MVFEDDTALSAHLKEKKTLRAYWFYGDEPYLIDRFTAKTVKAAAPGTDSLSVVKFDDKAELDDIFAEAITPSWFSGGKAIVADGFALHELSKDKSEKLFGFLKEIPEFTTVIFTTVSSDKRSLKSASITSAVKKFSQIGGVAGFAKRDIAGMTKFIKYEMNKRGCDISPADCRGFIERCGNDMYRVLGEIEKLCAAKEQGTVTSADIENYTEPVLESTVYNMTDAITRGDYKRSMKILKDLLWNKTEPVMIISALAGTYTDLFRAKTAIESGKGRDDILKLYDYHSTSFRVDNALRDCRSFTSQGLCESIRILRDADIGIKSGRSDEAMTVILQSTVTRLFDCRRM